MSHPGPVRSSSRPITPSTAKVDKYTVLEGHGEWVAVHGLRPYFKVPVGIEVVIYQGMGVGLDDQDGIDIGTGVGVPARMKTTFDAENNEYDTDPQGTVITATHGMRIYRQDESCPDLILKAYNERGYPVITPPQPGSYSVQQGHHDSLSSIAQLFAASGMSVQLRWAACTVLR